jgi:hypothetical protein
LSNELYEIKKIKYISINKKNIRLKQIKIFKQLYIFNGLGTKGVTYIPFYTHQIIEHILFQKPINKEVRIDRIKKNKIYRTV